MESRQRFFPRRFSIAERIHAPPPMRRPLFLRRHARLLKAIRKQLRHSSPCNASAQNPLFPTVSAFFQPTIFPTPRTTQSLRISCFQIPSKLFLKWNWTLKECVGGENHCRLEVRRADTEISLGEKGLHRVASADNSYTCIRQGFGAFSQPIS